MVNYDSALTWIDRRYKVVKVFYTTPQTEESYKVLSDAITEGRVFTTIGVGKWWQTRSGYSMVDAMRWIVTEKVAEEGIYVP